MALHPVGVDIASDGVISGRVGARAGEAAPLLLRLAVVTLPTALALGAPGELTATLGKLLIIIVLITNEN